MQLFTNIFTTIFGVQLLLVQRAELLACLEGQLPPGWQIGLIIATITYILWNCVELYLILTRGTFMQLSNEHIKRISHWLLAASGVYLYIVLKFNHALMERLISTRTLILQLLLTLLISQIIDRFWVKEDEE